MANDPKTIPARRPKKVPALLVEGETVTPVLVHEHHQKKWHAYRGHKNRAKPGKTPYKRERGDY